MPDWTPLPKTTDDEVEAQRSGDLIEAFEERRDLFADVQEMVDDFRPGTYGAHEALHAASMVLDQSARHLLGHPTILGDPQSYLLARRAHDSLFDLYQYLGAVHLPAIPEVSSPRTDAD